jgi:thiamine biosynthesis lipoprotein
MNYKKFSIQLIVLIFVLLLLYFATHSAKKGEYVSVSGFAQGTTYHITYESKMGENLQRVIDSLLADFDMSLSIYQPNSLISRINRNEPGVKADWKFKTIFNKSFEVYQKTDGAFDITVGPVVNVLGFGSTDTLNVDSTMIDSLLQYVGMDKVRMQDDLLIKEEKNTMLDVNAIAQGYSVDIVAAILEEKKIKNYLVEIGGEVRAKGRNARNQIWRIGIDKPIEGNMFPGAELQAIVELKNRSLATSGNYRKFYEKDGVKYVHTINPETGYPVISNLLSATVLANDCMTADAYATALMVFGVERSIDFLNKNKFLDAYLIYSDEKGSFQIYKTDGLSKYIIE